jgi:hypothetical protein
VEYRVDASVSSPARSAHTHIGPPAPASASSEERLLAQLFSQSAPSVQMTTIREMLASARHRLEGIEPQAAGRIESPAAPMAAQTTGHQQNGVAVHAHAHVREAERALAQTLLAEPLVLHAAPAAAMPAAPAAVTMVAEAAPLMPVEYAPTSARLSPRAERLWPAHSQGAIAVPRRRCSKKSSSGVGGSCGIGHVRGGSSCVSTPTRQPRMTRPVSEPSPRLAMASPHKPQLDQGRCGPQGDGASPASVAGSVISERAARISARTAQLGGTGPSGPSCAAELPCGASASAATADAGSAETHAEEEFSPFLALALAHAGPSWRELVENLPTAPGARAARMELFDEFDPNGNGHLSLAEVEKGLLEGSDVMRGDAELLRVLKPAVMRAFQAAKGSSGVGGVSADYVEKREFRLLLLYLVRFVALLALFRLIDSNGDKRIDLAEFRAALPVLRPWGVQVQDPEATFKQIDANGGGYILFEELAHWGIHTSIETLRGRRFDGRDARRR